MIDNLDRQLLTLAIGAFDRRPLTPWVEGS